MWDKMPPLDEHKNPAVAFIVGCLFGAVGVGVYFKSFLDFLVPFVVFIVASILGVGVGPSRGGSSPASGDDACPRLQQASRLLIANRPKARRRRKSMIAAKKRADLLKGPQDYEKRVRRIARIVRDRFAEWIPATQFVQSAIGGAISDEQHGKSQHAGVVRRAVHKAIDWLRRLQTQEKHQHAVGMWNGVMTTVGPEEEAVGNELREAVERAVAELNNEEQHIWRLLQQDYTPREIAGIVGKTAGAVRVQKTRILGKIREMLPLDYRRIETAVVS